MSRPTAGTVAPVTVTGPDCTGTTVPPGSTTRTRATVSDTRHSWNAAVWLTGLRPGTPSSSRARVASTGAGSST